MCIRDSPYTCKSYCVAKKWCINIIYVFSKITESLAVCYILTRSFQVYKTFGQKMEIVQYCCKRLEDGKSSEKLKVEDGFLLGYITGTNGASIFTDSLKFLTDFRAIQNVAKLPDTNIEAVIQAFIQGNPKDIANIIQDLAKDKESSLSGSNQKQKVEESKKEFLKAVCLNNQFQPPSNKMSPRNMHIIADNCAVCKEKIRKGKTIVTSACYHAYHRDCIAAIIRSQLELEEYFLTCPVDSCSKKISLRKLVNIVKAADIREIILKNIKAKGKYDAEKVLKCKTECCPYFDMPKLNTFSCPLCGNSYCTKCNLKSGACKGHDDRKERSKPNIRFHKKPNGLKPKFLPNLNPICFSCKNEILSCTCN
eukprot:TRINITY_DN10888_c0_g1_i14.p1 TRINITY_DN10888_c0_g1~~TRINITY_DN10888_c0_g1_i14.p1  ORF type:complete len:366 (+),score=46.08 TRINITY_DN10888_c0_g1_i14:73-1170(+)